jgi:signal transduction histidine kinase
MITSVIHKRLDQSLLNDTEEFSSLMALKGLEELKITMQLEAKSEGQEKMFIRVLSVDGQELAATDMSSWGNVDIEKSIFRQLRSGKSSYVFTTTLPLKHQHKTRILYKMIEKDKILQMGLSLEDDELFFEVLREKFILVMAIIMIFAIISGWFMAKRALRGVEEITHTAEEIAKGEIQRRVLLKDRGEEINKLSRTFNNMLDRISTLLTSMKEMTDNVAHDLRSPITRIRGIAEMALTSGRSTDDYINMAVNTIEECDRLLGMINTMLDITEIEAGAGKLFIDNIDIAGIVKDACELFQPIAEDKSITLSCTVPEICYVNGDLQKLQRMTANILDNALKFTPSGGMVRVTVNGNEEESVIAIEDTGSGISEIDLPYIFHRFYRCDKSRSQTGSGLGLSLSMAIAKAHGGNITAASSSKGTTFTITIPTKALPQVNC